MKKKIYNVHVIFAGILYPIHFGKSFERNLWYSSRILNKSLNNCRSVFDTTRHKYWLCVGLRCNHFGVIFTPRNSPPFRFTIRPTLYSTVLKEKIWSGLGLCLVSPGGCNIESYPFPWQLYSEVACSSNQKMMLNHLTWRECIQEAYLPWL